jgi:hypothetical protein
MLQACSSDPAGQYSAFFSLEFAEHVGVFEIHMFDLGFTEAAYFRGAGSSFPSPSLSFIVLHNYLLVLILS